MDFDPIEERNNHGESCVCPDFMRSAINRFYYSSCFIAIIAIFFVFASGMIVVGAIFFKECRAEPLLPIYLIVSGVLLILEGIVTLFSRRSKVEYFCIYFLRIILLGWIIVGCVWVYWIYPPEYKNKSDLKYCNKTLYLCAFLFVAISSGLIALMFILLIIISVVLACIVPRFVSKGVSINVTVPDPN